jgi:hypothetical protein
MRTSDTTLARVNPKDSGNSLVNELLKYNVAYDEAVETVTEDNPFLTYYGGSEQIEMTFPGSLRQAADQHRSLYIVAPDNPIESFSLIARKVIPNTLASLPKSALRKALGTLLDNA